MSTYCFNNAPDCSYLESSFYNAGVVARDSLGLAPVSIETESCPCA
jgi:hypothetical protein